MFSAILALALLGGVPVSDHLQNVSVTIRTDRGEGSGVIKTRTDKEGNSINFIWTAGHVVDSAKSSREVVTPDGAKRTVIEFGDVKIVKHIVEEGRTIGRIELDSEVIRYSDADVGEDLALLRVRKKNYVKDNVQFYLDKDKAGKPVIPALGTQLYHVGSLFGQAGSNSMTTGIYSQIGRVFPEVRNKAAIFDQTTVTAVPGSSGGGVYLTDGRYVGMLVRGAGETFNFIVPMRRMEAWAKKVGVLWAISDNVPLPADEDIRKVPVEDNSDLLKKIYDSLKPKSKETKFLLKAHEDEVERCRQIVKDHDMIINSRNWGIQKEKTDAFMRQVEKNLEKERNDPDYIDHAIPAGD